MPDNIKPYPQELPSSYAERLGELYTLQNDGESKKNKGQYFTSCEIARFMASRAKTTKKLVRILDPGCGIGILSIALIESIVKKNDIQVVYLVAFEIDSDIIQYSESAFEYLREWLELQDIHFSFFLCKNDFIFHNSQVLKKDFTTQETYDFIISNPPYFKLSKGDPRIKLAFEIGSGQVNIYSIFMMIAARLLAVGGTFIFITPRSFCSGQNFKFFRKNFFLSLSVEFVHLFHSRVALFGKDKVTQENIILEGKKLSSCHDTELLNREIMVSSSINTLDMSLSKKKKYKLRELLAVDTEQMNFFIPTKREDEIAIKLFKNWSGSLVSLGYGVSTGPVVDFRSMDIIDEIASEKSIPLFWLHNVKAMQLEWPIKKETKRGIKGQFIQFLQNDARMVESREMIFIRRFSSKDDSKRLIAAPYFKSMFPYDYIGIENHLNYIYTDDNRPFDKTELYGLSALFNSKLFDTYFRSFNGNTNVSATELRNFPLPPKSKVREVGRLYLSAENQLSLTIDEIIAQVFKIKS